MIDLTWVNIYIPYFLILVISIYFFFVKKKNIFSSVVISIFVTFIITIIYQLVIVFVKGGYPVTVTKKCEVELAEGSIFGDSIIYKIENRYVVKKPIYKVIRIKDKYIDKPYVVSKYIVSKNVDNDFYIKLNNPNKKPYRIITDTLYYK